jgi:hypothetical protein
MAHPDQLHNMAPRGATMTDEWRNVSGGDSSDLELQGLVQSLSDWVELDALSNVPVSQTVQQGGSYGNRLMSLQSARRFLNVRIEDEQRMGRPTGDLEQELELKRVETRSFLKYLEVHARAYP